MLLILSVIKWTGSNNMKHRESVAVVHFPLHAFLGLKFPLPVIPRAVSATHTYTKLVNKWDEGERGGGRGEGNRAAVLSCPAFAMVPWGGWAVRRECVLFLSVHVQRASLPAHPNSHLNSNLSPAERHRQKHCYPT